MNNNEMETLVIYTDNGKTEVVVLAVYDIDDKHYIAVTPKAQSKSEAPDVLIYGYEIVEDTEDAMNIINISDEEYSAARSALESILEAEFDEELDK